MTRLVKPQSREVCSRCLQPVALKAARCPRCGNQVNSFRSLPIVVGIVGMIALVFVIVIMIQVVKNVDIESAPPEARQQDDPMSVDPKPQTSAEQEKPSQPEKPPPLNQ